MATALFDRKIAWSQENLTEEGHRLTLKCWAERPWLVNVYSGGISDARERLIIEWLTEEFGPQAWPLHGKPGDWYQAGVTIQGWCDFGFATEQMMTQFQEAWPNPEPSS